MVDKEVQSEPVVGETGGSASKGGLKLVIGVIILLVVVAAVAVYAQQGGFSESQDEEEQGEMMGQEELAPPDVQAMEGVDMMEPEQMLGEGEINTIIDNGAGFVVDAPVEQAKSFDVTGKNFEFSTKEIRVKKGDVVTINFLSTEGTHNWVVDEFTAATETVNAGKSSTVVFIAETVGEFEYYCGVGSHRALGMVGKLIIEE
ncbi:hypothetical protein BK004_00770 [bacterium CG10_46_32]|nr:MAG: hypothetical protein BK004_00770 [bacterium CG10_46_32]PIR56430.1 MAG: hypothetical protein COU73_00780 [Parcubacteria group bacterium CG10_big_fil_rev_8_21_14_0_10_46_32]